MSLAIIKYWLSTPPPGAYQSVEITRIVIACTFGQGGQVLMDKSCTRTIRFAKNGPVLSVPGGTNTPQPVNCPHFENL
ncbi:hypothetical protein A3C34_04075 [Candidatus Amesbacteria bacterium RIFCSPHIGHO2_02_FULL_48_21]|uniref:Uncharacterized protein n=1 Tax=Candidatus Amesbacteria bacterium RIFOXYD1_FULL_47_9 TaxID=1797267 RepID=A0A1F4ZXC9_9BACT|nr:MAG: hypothetical protein A3C34_04075 [Candidatus Amesbacteria bacterium RIFCSPHIGHO2_02_FULL_48_21]OGD11032.1 MAG: hypothetical protein A2576_00310 [Candidatus Amesbacteria bacterium RIFOXYD1_FULL_47_9]